MNPSIVSNAASLVRRSRVGDQNAMALIYRVGEEARKGNAKAIEAAKAIEEFAKKNPSTAVSIDMPKPVIADTQETGGVVVWKADTEKNKPALPRGALHGVLDPDHFCDVIAGAARYRFGLDAASVVLASGPMLTKDAIDAIVDEVFDEKTGKIFLYGVVRCAPDDYDKAAQYLNTAGRQFLTVGQCFGRARKLQALRQPRSRIGAYSQVAGWELGE